MRGRPKGRAKAGHPERSEGSLTTSRRPRSGCRTMIEGFFTAFRMTSCGWFFPECEICAFKRGPFSLPRWTCLWIQRGVFGASFPPVNTFSRSGHPPADRRRRRVPDSGGGRCCVARGWSWAKSLPSSVCFQWPWHKRFRICGNRWPQHLLAARSCLGARASCPLHPASCRMLLSAPAGSRLMRAGSPRSPSSSPRR
jgi:hypothetical protein